MKSSILSTSLKGAMSSNGINQKYLALDTGTPQSTVSDHVKGKQPVTIVKAAEYAESIKDSKFSLEVAYIFFGTISTMTGSKYQNNPLALDILQQKESNERKAKKYKALEILTLNDGMLSLDDKAVILDYAGEYLDEIMVETTLLVSLLGITGTSIMDAVKGRVPYWQNVGYMGKE